MKFPVARDRVLTVFGGVAALVIAAVAVVSAQEKSELGTSNALSKDRQKVLRILLKNSGFGSDTNSLLTLLSRLKTTPQQKQRVAKFVKQLSSPDFFERESATRELISLGNASRKQVINVVNSRETETAWRAREILKRLDSGRQKKLQNALLFAAIELLKNRQDPKAVPILFEILPLLEEQYLKDLATETIWVSTNSTHESVIRRAISSDDKTVIAASLVALELALGEKAMTTIRPFLKSESPHLQLAAVRALIDRKPLECVPILLKLVDEPDHEVFWQADTLLQMISGRQMEWSSERTLGQAWESWAADGLTKAKLKLPLGWKRLDFEAGRNRFREDFSRPVESLAKGYGLLQYEADNGGQASISGGQLRIQAGAKEGDQRVFLSSQRLLNRPAWPRHIEIRGKLGGQTGNNYGWHVGISIGQVKVLFHPGLAGGEFRVETTDQHQNITQNEKMGFTPATDQLYEMSLKISKEGRGAAIDITVRNHANSNTFRKQLTVSDEQLGEFNRIGFERSGREGGAALFDDVLIQFKR